MEKENYKAPEVLQFEMVIEKRICYFYGADRD